MKIDDKLKKLIKEEIDDSMEHIDISQKTKEEILRKALTKESLIKRFLEYEIVIPVSPAIAVITAVFITISYMVYPIVRIDEKDILSSKIEVVNLNLRR